MLLMKKLLMHLKKQMLGDLLKIKKMESILIVEIKEVHLVGVKNKESPLLELSLKSQKLCCWMKQLVLWIEKMKN